MIIVNLDVMMARRKMSLNELSECVGITVANLSILKTGKAKVAPQSSGGRRSRINWRGYDYSTGSGIQTIFESIAQAIKNNLIAFGIGGYENSASLKGQGEVVFEDNSTSSDILFDDTDRTENASKVNFYNKSGELSKVGFMPFPAFRKLLVR